MHELSSPLDGFAGLARILILADDFVVVEVGVGLHAVLLRLEGVTVNLHGGGYAGIRVYLGFLFHSIRSMESRFPVSKRV